MRTRVYPLVVIVLAAWLASGCAMTERERYRRAITDAAVATPAKQLSLLAIPDADPVRVVWWTRPSNPIACHPPACAVPRPAQTDTEQWTWVTLDPEVRTRCRAWGLAEPDLSRRLRELLGLPPADVERVFVVFTAPQAALVRPCLATTVDGQRGEVCALTPTRGAPQPVNVLAARQMADSYFVDESTRSGGRVGYPYTRLGYTYDWGRDARADHYGASEFVIPASTAITVIERYTTAEFCAP